MISGSIEKFLLRKCQLKNQTFKFKNEYMKADFLLITLLLVLMYHQLKTMLSHLRKIVRQNHWKHKYPL
jgi:hypothetical protein